MNVCVCMSVMNFTSSHIFILELAGKSFDRCEGRRLVDCCFEFYDILVIIISYLTKLYLFFLDKILEC